MTRRTHATILGISLITLVAIAAAYVATRPPADVGDTAAVEASLDPSPAPTAPPSTFTPPGASPLDDSPPSPGITIRSGLLADQPPPADAPVPVGLRMGSIDVDAPVIHTGVDRRTGQMAVPGNVREVAWYEFGPRPGEAGSAVLAAHVDLASQGAGVFFRLRDLDPDDVVEVEFSDGSVRRFQVEARTTYDKDELPLDTIFARDGAPVLTLVTCGGGFSASSASYDSNVVVYAVPIDDDQPTR